MNKKSQKFQDKRTSAEVPSRFKAKKRIRFLVGAFFARCVYWLVILTIWSGVGFAGLIAYYGALMPHAKTWMIPEKGPNIRILSEDRQLIADRGAAGKALRLKKISPFVGQAVVAIEDRRFYLHHGIDLVGMLRAAFANLLAGGSIVQGGSTITQQLAKNLFLTAERTLKRKIQELFLALWLESKYSKQHLLEIYLNRMYFGSGAYGIDAASRRYFLKSADRLTLPEAALLAALLKAPSRLSPLRNRRAANQRARLVLQAMLDQNMITPAEMEKALKQFPVQVVSPGKHTGDYVADRVISELTGLLGEVRTDIIVHTTIDSRLQSFAEHNIRQLIDEKGKKFDVSQGALVCIDNAGRVRALVGGHDYASSPFDRASEAQRQPGSAFKPFVFLAALERGETPESIWQDAPIRIGNWRPQNYKGKYYGPVSLGTALSWSLNSVAVRLVMATGVDSVIRTAHRLGIRSPLHANSSIALGTSEVTLLELTAAYIPFANGGFRPKIHFIKQIKTERGEELYRTPVEKLTPVMRPGIVAMMNAMLARTVQDGTGRNANFSWPSAGKTGTSQKFRDAWFIGYTAFLTTGIWFGNDNEKPSRHLSGSTLPAIAWRRFMEKAHEGMSPRPLAGNQGALNHHMPPVAESFSVFSDHPPESSHEQSVKDIIEHY